MRIGKGTTRGTLLLIRGTIGVGTPHKIETMKFPYLKLGGWSGGWVSGGVGDEVFCIIQPLWGSILQVATWKIFDSAENPRWSRMWQNIPGTQYNQIKTGLLVGIFDCAPQLDCQKFRDLSKGLIGGPLNYSLVEIWIVELYSWKGWWKLVREGFKKERKKGSDTHTPP